MYRFIMHDDDQIVPTEFSLRRSARLIKNARPQIQKGRLTRHLMAFLEAKAIKPPAGGGINA
jgi:hypothetical protein